MTPAEFIDDAIRTGERTGIASLDPDQRLVYLISEAECLSDMEGIDSFLEKYSPVWLSEAAAAFEAVGATEIAVELRVLPTDSPVGDPRLDRINSLVTARSGYDYEAIRRVVAQRLSTRCD